MADELHVVKKLAGHLGDARPSDRRLGEEITAAADVDVGHEGAGLVVTVGATPRSGGRTVCFHWCGDETTWSCTCTREASPWCKHVVAAVLRVAEDDHDR